MIAQRYDEKKKAVLDICNRYLSFRGNTDDGVNVDFLKKRMKDLENDRYVLMVVGEAKAGKSTFINALLGEPILPTGVLQSSSAIVEIFKSDEKYVKVRYADGHVKRVQDNPDTPDLDEASEFLRQVGAAKDEYRSIPTTLIDKYIVEGRIRPGHPLPIDELEATSKLSLRDKEMTIQEYVEGRTLADIPEKITVGFPLKYDFDGFRLVDSPGVNALGGVQDATHAYIHEANALLFLHSLDSPIESASFRKFIDDVVSNRARETLFLVLTKSGKNPSDDIEMKVERAHRLYTKKIDQNRILAVDSLLKIISDEIEESDSADSLKEHYRQQEQALRAEERGDEASTFQAKRRLLNQLLDDIDGDPDCKTVQSELRALSNFDEMERIIAEFSNWAPDLNLLDLLTSVRSGYKAQNRDLGENLSVWKEKREHPQTFESEISKIQNLLEDYQLSMNTHTEDVSKKFTGRHASYRTSLEKIATEYKDRISRASVHAAVRKALTDFHDEIDSFADKIGARIKSEFENELRRLGEKFKTEHDITVPTVDVSGIEAETRDQAYRTIEEKRDPKGVWEWIQKIITFGDKVFYEKKNVYDANLHLHASKEKARAAVVDKAREFDRLVSNLIHNITPDFRSSLKSRVDSRNKELEDIKTRKADNEEILKEINEAEKKKKYIAAELTRVSDMFGGLS